MTMSRSFVLAVVVAVVLGMLVPSIHAVGNLKVDNIFASAGPLITVNRLSTSVATVSQSSTDTVQAAPNEFVVNAPQLSIDSSYVTVTSAQDLNVVSTGSLSLSSGGNLRLDSQSVIEVSSTTSDVTINAPQSATAFLSHNAHLDANSFTFSSGKGGFDVVAQGGPVDIMSPLASVSVSSGGVGDIAAVADVTLYSANGLLQVSGDTTSLYAKERVTVFADSALTATAPNFVVRAADDLGISSAAINIQGGSVVVGSKTQEVSVTAGTNVVASAKQQLSISGAGQGVTIHSVGGSGSITASGTVSLVSTSGTGVVSIHSDASVTSTSLTATAAGTTLTLDGDQSVTFGSGATATTKISGSDIQLTSGTSTTFNSGAITTTGTYLFSSAKDELFFGQNTVSIGGLGGSSVINMNSAGDQAVSASGGLVLNNLASTSVFAIGGAFGCGDVQFNTQSASLTLGQFSLIGGAASIVAQTALSAAYPGAISFSAGSDANGALLFDAGNLLVQTISKGSTQLTSTLGAIDYLLAGTSSWNSPSIKFAVSPGPASFFGNTYLGLIGGGIVSLTASGDLSILSTTNIQSNSNTFLLQSLNANVALKIHGAASYNATNGIQVSASDKLIISNTPLNSNLDSVSFTGGVGIFTATNTFDFTAFRKDVTVNAGQDVLITTTGSNIDFETIDGGFGYVNAASKFSSSASDSLIAGENIRTSSAGSTSLLAYTAKVQISDRGITTYSVNQDTSVSGLAVTFSSDSALVGTFGRDETVYAYGALQVTSGGATSVLSSAGTVSISSRVDQLQVTTGRNAYFQTGGLADSTVDFEVGQSSILQAQNLFSAQVSQDSLRFHGSTISVSAAKRYSVVGDNQASYVGTTTTVAATSARTQVYGGSINFSTVNNNLFVEAGTDIIVRSELGSNYGFLVDPPAVAGIEDTINFRTKRNLVWNSGQSINIHSSSNTTFTVNRLFVDDDDDGDGGLMFTANTGQVSFITPSNHDNDVWIASGGAVSITAQSVSQPMTWTSAYDTYTHAARAVSITGHTGGAFSVNADLGYVRLDSDAGLVNIASNGGKATFASTLPNSNGGAPVFVVAQNQVSITSASAQFIATGASPLSLPNAPGRTDGGQLVSDPSNIVGISVRTTDSSGNIAIDARNAGLKYTSGNTFYIDGPNNATLTSDSGFTISTGSTTSIDSEDGTTQLQGATGTSFVTANQLAFEASRLLSFQTQDQLRVTSAMSSVTFFSQSGNIDLRTQFFNPITVSAQAVSILAGGSGADITGTDKIVSTAGLQTQLSGTRGVTVSTIGGKILLQSETATPNKLSTITAQQNVTLQGGSRLTINSADTVVFSALQNTTFSATGGGISIGASTSAALTAVHSLELKSGTSTNQKTTADRTLLQTNTLAISGSQRLALDPTSFLRIGASTSPTVNINGGGTPVDYGIIVGSQGNILINTDSTLAFTAKASASVDSGYEGSEFVSTTDTLFTSTLGNVLLASPNGRLDLSAGTTATITAVTSSTIASGGLLSIASVGANPATASVSFKSSGALSLTSPLISLHSPTVTFQTTGGVGTSIAATVQRAAQLNAGGRLTFMQSTAAAADSISIKSGDWQLYQSDALPVVGTSALSLTTTNSNNIAVSTSGIQSDIDLISFGVVSLAGSQMITFTSTMGIEIDAGKGVDPGFGSDVQFLPKTTLTFSAHQAVFNASQSMLLTSVTKDVSILTAAGAGGRVFFDSESTLSIISTSNDITMTAKNVASFSAGVDLLFNLQKLAITAATGQVVNNAGGLFSVKSATTMVLTANGAGGVVIPNLPNEPKLSDTFRVTVDAPNIPLTLTAPNDVAFSSKTSVLITAGQENGERGYAKFNAGTELDVRSTGNVVFQSTGNADQIGGTADTVFTSTTTMITSSAAGIVISGSGTRPDAGYVSFNGATQTYMGVGATISSSKSAIFESAGVLSLKSTSEAYFVATGPVDSDPKAAYGVSVDSVNALKINPSGIFGVYPATDANLIGQTVTISATTLGISSYSPSNDGSSTGIDMISHGPNGISFSSTTGFTWTAGGVLSIESERTVGITAGTTIMMTNPAVAATSTYIHASQGISFIHNQVAAAADTITANTNLQFSAGQTLSVSAPNSQAILKTTGGQITLTGDAGIVVTGAIDFTAATVSQTVVGVDSVLFTTTTGNLLIGVGSDGFTFTSGSVKSKAPSGDINFSSSSITFDGTAAGTTFSLQTGDNVLGYSFKGETWTGNNINLLAWNGGIQFRSISISTPTGAANDRVVSITATTSITITAGTWQSQRQHKRLRFFEACDASGSGTRFGVGSTQASQLGGQFFSNNWCYCPGIPGSHCTCPWEQSVANQIYWALADYGLIFDPAQNPQ